MQQPLEEREEQKDCNKQSIGVDSNCSLGAPFPLTFLPSKECGNAIHKVTELSWENLWHNRLQLLSKRIRFVYLF